MVRTHADQNTDCVTTPTPAAETAAGNATARRRLARRGGRPGANRIALISVFIRLALYRRFPGRLCVPSSSTLVLVMNIAQHPPMQWYLDALYMNQGHSFFAPDVGPGHLIRYQLLDQSGHEIEQGDFPSRKEHWPRLLYHRYFMLADQSRCQPTTKRCATIGSETTWKHMAANCFARHPQAQTVVAATLRPLATAYRYVMQGSLQDTLSDQIK